MKHPRLILGGVLILFLAAGIIYALVSQRPIAITPPPAGATDVTYTQADVSAHKTAADCWTSIEGSVYDLTTWINRHPGGPQTIIGLCGNDGTASFNGQHGSSRKPRAALILLKVGTLK